MRIGEASRFSHAPIMSGFPAPAKKKNHGKMATNASTGVAFHPLTWEKSLN
jgi:hypothetical protein